MENVNRIARVKVRLQGKKYVLNVQDELNVVDKDINEELEKQPLLLFFWSRLLHRARKIHREIKNELREVEESIFKQKYLVERRTNEYANARFVQAIVDEQPEVVKLKKEVDQAEDDVSTLQGIVRAFEERGRILVSISANRRKEI